MKIILNLLFLFFTISFYGQSEIKITSKKCISKKGIHLKLKNVFDDSRCPEGVTCVWAGEVSATIEVYKERKKIEEKSITFNAVNREENIKWLEHYFSKKIKGIAVLPYPKEGKIVRPKNKYIRIVFVD